MSSASLRHLALALACLLLTAPAFASGRAECDSLPSKVLGRSVRYCALLPESYDRDKARKFPVLYELHGLGNNEQTFVSMGLWNTLDSLREQKKIGDLIVATPDAGISFYVNSFDHKTRYEEFFLREFIPYIEHRYRGVGTRAGRAVGGVSMGGYGALHYAFGHPEMFRAVAVHSAALIEDIPQGTRFGGPGSDVLTPFGKPFNAAVWKANSPFTLAKTAGVRLNGLKIYFDCGEHDDYGFEDGAQALHKQLTKAGVAHEFHLYPGSHNVRYFAAHLPESITFASQAMGGR